MAWRLQDHVIRGELDFTQRGFVTGQIWFAGLAEPVVLGLSGYPGCDLAGHRLAFTNPEPKPGTDWQGFAMRQSGSTGDITASRKVKVPECSMEELLALIRAKQPFPWHWGNSLYLEWFSGANGRVVIESPHYELKLDAVGAWTLTEEDEAARRAEADEAMMGFLGDLTEMSPADDMEDSEAPDDEDEDISELEKEADAEASRMDLLLDRVDARLKREGKRDSETLDRVMKEERERLRKELGEPEPEPPTWEQLQEQEARIESLREAEEQAMQELEENPDAWANIDKDHPLVERCMDLAVRLMREVQDAGWLDAAASREHPMQELVDGVQIAAAKLGGALNGSFQDGVWPPPDYAIGNTLVRLKKARQLLRDALAGADSALADGLAPEAWLITAKLDIQDVLDEVLRLIAELRGTLE